ncbi:Crp/Fnr family transcriptional regulator [soil metagenome]
MENTIKDTNQYNFEEPLLREIENVGISKSYMEGEKIIEIGDYITSMPLLLSGAVKILREDNEGDELLLYFLKTGDTCAITLSCCLGQTQSEIRAIAETDTRLLMIPVSKMEEWTGKYKTWRNFVFKSYHTRLTEMLDTIDTLAFMKMDGRLLRYLKDKVKINKSNTLNVTHQEVAHDLHTSRVVISRLLKKLELDGNISLGRNIIKINDL